jgi:RNA polymerase sigma-70 factor (ECF subfamily)
MDRARGASRTTTPAATDPDGERERDRALALDLIAGKPQAFEPFVERFGPLILNFGRRMCGQRDDAEEVLQETLLRAYRSLRRLRDPAALRAWVYRVAANSCLKLRRSGRREPAGGLALATLLPARGGDGALPHVDDWSDRPLERLLRRELGAVLERAILALPRPFRVVVVLRDQEGFSTREVARILGITETLVKVRLHRARLALRKALDGYLAAAPAGARPANG